ncbi:MAG: VTT domain-containing protein [bacterium]
METKAKKALLIINISVIIFIISLLVILAIYFWDDLKLLGTTDGQIEFTNRIKNTGILGVLIVILINILQVVVAFIPGEFIEIISGILFGPFFGMIVCLIGFALGTMVIFGLVKVLGKPFIDLNVNEKSRKRLKFLEDETRALIILFFVFLIPGTPKDFITYAIPFTKIKMLPFIIITSIARIPSVITSTIIGSAIINGQSSIAISVTVITFIVAILGIIFNKKITTKVEKIIKRNKEV